MPINPKRKNRLSIIMLFSDLFPVHRASLGRHVLNPQGKHPGAVDSRFTVYKFIICVIMVHNQLKRPHFLVTVYDFGHSAPPYYAGIGHCAIAARGIRTQRVPTVHLKCHTRACIKQAVFGAIGCAMKVKHDCAIVLNLVSKVEWQQIRHA